MTTQLRAARLLLISCLAFLISGGLPRAQALTLDYVGPGWDTGQCAVHYPPGSACIGGSLTGSLTFAGVPDTYSGTLNSTNITSWTYTGSGVTTLGTGNTISANFTLSSGQPVSWSVQSQLGSGGITQGITSVGTSGGYDTAYTLDQTTGLYIKAGWITVQPYGTWINPKILGRPANIPQVAEASPTVFPQSKPDCPQDGCSLGQRGEPIDLGTGNMFEQVTDYTTVGQNKLAFIRYYNSMATPDTLATALGRNWRSNYDRYLRIVSSTEVDAERSDGQVVAFILVGSTWTPDTDVDMTLTNAGSTWTLTDHDDTVETYTAPGATGTLNTIALPNGYTQTLNYTSGVLTSVSDSYSRSLSFTYTGGLLTGVTTPDSATLTYGYTATAGQNLLTSVTYNTSPSTSQTYSYTQASYPFALTGITDENGNSYASWSYDTLGRCTQSAHAGGADQVSVTYNSATNVTVTNPLGEQETYHLTNVQGVSKVTQIDRAASAPVAAASEFFTYDTNGFLATATDWNGNSIHYTNNSHGQPTGITEAFGTGRARTSSITYDSTWVHKPYTITKTNVTIDDRYDTPTGNLLTHTLTDTTGGSTNGHTHVWTYTYNGTGQMLTEAFPRTGTTVKNTYTYSGGKLSSISDQLSHVTTINTANGTGQPTQITDPNSVVTNFTYDNRNRLLTKSVVASPSNELTTYTYIGSGQPNVITLPDSSTIDYDYDTAQRVTKITNTGGETVNYTLDAMGDVTAMSIKDSGGTVKKSYTATYDVLGDRLTLVGAGGVSQTTSYAYDGMRNRTSTTNANSKQWQQAWDELLRPTTATDPLTHTAAPTYNNLDAIIAQTDFNGYSTSYTRDAFGNAIGRTSPDTGAWSFAFDEDNNLTGITDARSVATANTFDAVDRLTGVSITGFASEAETFTYDSTTSGNKGIGRLTSFTDESGSTARVYNNFGNITSETRIIGGKTYTTSYSYDLANRLKEIVYPSGRFVDYTYNSSGYLTTVTTKPTSGGTVTTLASSIVHKPFGPIASFTYGNSEAQTRTYDNNYWLSTLNTVNGTTFKQKLSFGYDNAGNVTSITDNSDATRNQTFTVDDLNRLHTASGKYGSRTYTYDSNSNRATKVAGATTNTYSYTTGKNLLASYTTGASTRHFTNTSNGNMATDDRAGALAVTFTYGGRNRLESMSIGGPTLGFKVNALGQRTVKTSASGTTHYIHDIHGNIIAEANGSTGAKTKEYVWMEGQLLAQLDASGNIVYVHNDQVNAPQKITNPSRTTVWDRIQEPFGEDSSTPTTTTPTNHRFPGQYFDSEDTLNYNNMRDYDTTLGRYVEADVIGFKGGYNLFGYALANPTQWTDPSGKMAQAASGLLLTVWALHEVEDFLHNYVKDENTEFPSNTNLQNLFGSGKICTSAYPSGNILPPIPPDYSNGHYFEKPESPEPQEWDDPIKIETSPQIPEPTTTSQSLP
jgi:RHS repeat-associated protein